MGPCRSLYCHATSHTLRNDPSHFHLTLCRIPIEQRPAVEACLVRGALYPLRTDAEGRYQQGQVMITPAGLDADKDNVYNPSFDVTPAELITAIVTEKGVAVRKDGEKVFDLKDVV